MSLVGQAGVLAVHGRTIGNLDPEVDSVTVITAAPSQSLAAELAPLLPDLRAVVGPDRR